MRNTGTWAFGLSHFSPKPSIAVAGLLLAVGLGIELRSAEEAGARKIEVLFLGHEGEVHTMDNSAGHLVPELSREGINFSHTTNDGDLTAANLSMYDVLLVYGDHPSITPAQEKALLEFVGSGNGLVAVHSAASSFVNSPAYARVLGGQIDRHGTGAFTARIVRPEHPAMLGIAPFEGSGETFVHKNTTADRVVLMERVDGDRAEAWTWVRNQGKGRVFYTAYGHDERTWKQPEFQALVRNAILWVAGDSVRSAWERLELPPVTRRASSHIANYERRPRPLKYQVPLSPEASMKLMQVPPGFELELYAAEPDIVKPIAMAWDERGRLWIAETLDYPNDIHPGQAGRDRIKIVEDTNGDGRADRFTIFADGLNIPTSLMFHNGGLIVSQAPEILFLKDTDGDGRSDLRQVVSAGWGTRDTHAGPSNLRYGFDNHIWGAVGYSGFQGTAGGATMSFAQGVWRMRPDGSRIEFMGGFSNNTWGLGFSETFDLFGSTANNTHAIHVGIPNRFSSDVRGLPVRAGSKKIDGHYSFSPNTPNIRQVDVFGGFTAAAGFNLYTARAFPKEYWNRIALVSEPTGRLVHRAILEKEGAGFREKDGWNLVASVDEWFAPVDAQVGPDGAVWLSDWYNFIVQHNPTPSGFQTGKGNAHVNPLRDQSRGRIYRLVYKAAPKYKPLTLSKERPAELIGALSNDNLFWRLTAQRLLVERGRKDVAPQLYQLARNRRVDELGLNPGALHALWTLEGLGMLDGSNAQATTVAVEAMRHPSAGVRKAALQVQPETEDTLKSARSAGLLEDPDPHTRLAAILLLARLRPSDELGALAYQLGRPPEVEKDEWLSQAVYIAGAHHRAGYLKAYAADLGAEPFRSLAKRIAEEESTRPAAPPSPPFSRRPQAQPSGPVAGRLLRTYVEDIVGPITRPAPASFVRGGGGNFGGANFGAASEAGAGPALEMKISVVPQEMQYTVTSLTVKPGQLVRLTLTNPDDMQHNLVFVRPGTTEAVGTLVNAMAKASDAADRNYVPSTPDVLAWTTLADPGQSVTLEFTAPRQPGEYPYICTFPGHWRTMQGIMKVAE